MDVGMIFKIAAIGILTSIVCQVLKKADRDDMATLVSLVALVITLFMVVDMVSELFDTLKSLFGAY